MNAPVVIEDLRYSAVEDEVRANVRSLLERHAGWESVLKRTESTQLTDLALWTKLATEMGLAGLAVPEDRGGAGAGWREVAVVCEELGRAVAPVPYLGSAVIATALLLELDEPGLLAEVASGERIVALAVPFDTAPLGPFPGTVEVRPVGLHGTVTSVADAGSAHTLLVVAGGSLYAVDPASTGVTRTLVVTLDMTRPLVDLSFDGAQGRLLSTGPQSAIAIERALQVGAALLASEQLGLAQRCLAMTVEYLLVRRQFGRVLGSYQSLKHRLADLAVLLEQAVAVARYAAGCAADGDPDLPVAAALAQAHCSVVAQQAAEECLQMHGGIGFTWEHPAHLYLKRAKSAAVALGTADRHRATLATLLDIPGAT
ncbi:acyl-CoA dehydrogenase family protein [Mycobacterium sp.]|uniref:acyl-CoA dehydrogenase family protein n=1 Tax=Mycobacterium sp. TaxID=1785 RepID=UPI003BB1C752